MVQHGKCDTCRKRKLKCDEGRPSCGTCTRSSRTCSYKVHTSNISSPLRLNGYEHEIDREVRNTSTLRLRSTRRAGRGYGVFQTFVPGVSPAPLLSNPFTKLASEWVHLLEYFPTGFYSNFLPRRFGVDSTLDAAAAHTCKSLQYFMTQDKHDLQIVQTSGIKAFRALRIALNSTKGDVSDETLIATLLLLNTAYLVGLQSRTYISHALGLSRMLKKRWMAPNPKWGEVEFFIYLAIFIEEAGHAIITGTESEQDDPLVHQLLQSAILTKYHELTMILIRTVRHIYSMPRLIMKIRMLRDTPNNSGLVQETLTLADNIFDSRNSQVDWETIETFTTITDSTKNPLGASINYSNDHLFVVALFFYHYRNLICGAIQTLFDIIGQSAPSSYFIRAVIEGEDLKAAENIIMSTEYALQSRAGPPFPALNITTPLGVSYRTWSRLRVDSQVRDDERLAEHAAAMQNFVYSSLKHVEALWRVDLMSTEKVLLGSEAYAGGPPIPDFFQ